MKLHVSVLQPALLLGNESSVDTETIGRVLTRWQRASLETLRNEVVASITLLLLEYIFKFGTLLVIATACSLYRNVSRKSQEVSCQIVPNISSS